MRKWLPLIATCLGSFMLLIDITIVNVALPDMTRDLATSFATLQWVIDAYALALAALLLGLGSLSDNLGHRRVYLFGLVVFTVASVACGLAPDGPALIAARAVQGVGGASMFATTFALLNGSYEGRDRGTAYGIWGGVSGAAAAAGPLLGGVLTEALSWRWIFFVNLPVGVATVALAVAVIPADAARRRRRVDLAGMVSFTVAAAALTFALIQTSEDGWTSPVVIGLIVATVVALVAFLLIEPRRAEPMIELAMFRRRMFTGTVVAGFVLSFAAFAALTYTTIWTQSLLGLSPFTSGLTLLPLPVLSAVLSATTGRVMGRFPRPLTIGGGLVLIGAGCGLTALLVTSHAGWEALIPGLALTGIGTGVSVPTLSSTASAAVGDERAGMASGAVNTARQLGQALGIALLGSLAAVAAEASLRSSHAADPSGAAHALVGGEAASVVHAAPPAARAGVDQALHGAFASGLDVAYIVSAVAAVAAAVLVAWLVRARPARADRRGDATEASRAPSEVGRPDLEVAR